jgi:hypothetical protein
MTSIKRLIELSSSATSIVAVGGSVIYFVLRAHRDIFNFPFPMKGVSEVSYVRDR